VVACMTELSQSDRPVPPDEVRAQLERILQSRALLGSEQLKRFLRLVVERTLNGQTDLLKEYNLGLEVFQRPPSYDPKADPIVRVQARRLRAKLDEYYATEGARDMLLVQMPKGAYVPVFGERKPSEPVPCVERHTSSPRLRVRLAMGLAVVMVVLAVAHVAWESATAPAGIHRSVAVLPLQMFTEGGGRAHIADQIAEVLTTGLAKREELQVLSRTTAGKYRESALSLPQIAQALNVRWVVEGGVGVEGSRAYVKLRLVDSLTDRKVWADVFDCEMSELVAVNTQVADKIAAAIDDELDSSQP
jgi:TolB-like protein